MSFSRLQLRRLAAFVLLGWMLALGVSVAHACGLMSGPAEDGHGAGTVHSRVALDHDLAGVSAGDQTPISADASCVKFCDESKNPPSGTGTLTASAPGHLDNVALLQLRPDLALLPLHTAWMRDQGQRPSRPLSIELLRLTL